MRAGLGPMPDAATRERMARYFAGLWRKRRSRLVLAMHWFQQRQLWFRTAWTEQGDWTTWTFWTHSQIFDRVRRRW